MLRYKKIDLSKLPDCCALSERGKCICITGFKCIGEQCTLKRNEKENSNSLQYVYHRLSILNYSDQIQIAKKYYGGSMPWSK